METNHTSSTDCKTKHKSFVGIFELLPEELHTCVMLELSVKDLFHFCLSCKMFWYGFARPILWKQNCSRSFSPAQLLMLRDTSSTCSWLSNYYALSSIPVKWSSHENFEVEENGGISTVLHTSDFRAAIQTTKAFPLVDFNLKFVYFEVTLAGTNNQSAYVIGIATNNYSRQNVQVGWEMWSFAYHSDDAGCFKSRGFPAYTFTLDNQPAIANLGDTMGMGIILSTEKLTPFWTKNDQLIEISKWEIPNSHVFKPSFSCRGIDDKAIINMKGPFKFNLENFLKQYGSTGLFK